MPADLGPAFLRSHMLYDNGAVALLSPQRRFCSCCRTRDRISSDDSLTMASLKVMVMSSDRSSGSKPAQQASVDHSYAEPNQHITTEFVTLARLLCAVDACCQHVHALVAYPFQLYVLAQFGPDWCVFSACAEPNHPQSATAYSPKRFPAPGSSLAGQADCLQNKATSLCSRPGTSSGQCRTELQSLITSRRM